MRGKTLPWRLDCDFLVVESIHGVGDVSCAVSDLEWCLMGGVSGTISILVWDGFWCDIDSGVISILG